MSGPKVSEYTLTSEQLAAIEAEIRRIQEEAALKAKLLQEKDTDLKNLQKQKTLCISMQNFLDKYKNWLVADGTQCSVAEWEIVLTDIIADLNHCSNNMPCDKLEATLNKVQIKIKRSQQLSQSLQMKLASLKKQLEENLSSEINELFDSPNLVENIQDNTVSESLSKFIGSLYELEDNQYLPISYKLKIKSAIERISLAKSTNNLKSFCQIELAELVKECNEFIALWQSIGEQYIGLCARYEALQKINGCSKLQMVTFSKDAIAKLTELIQVEEAKAKEYSKQEYIRTALSEVMREMGYDVLGEREVTKTNGKHFENELYKYGKDTAVNVTYADNGQITLELGKLDSEDRIPTINETNYLENAMVGFCTNFKTIENRLLEKGVVLENRIVLTPPSAQYAQIINVDDYDIVQEQGQKTIVKKHKLPEVRKLKRTIDND